MFHRSSNWLIQDWRSYLDEYQNVSKKKILSPVALTLLQDIYFLVVI